MLSVFRLRILVLSFRNRSGSSLTNTVEISLSKISKRMSSTDSGPEDRNPPQKKTSKRDASKLAVEETVETKTPTAKRKKESEAEKSDDGDAGGKIPLGSKKFISVSEFRGKKLVDVREWYGDDNDLKPGKKGISLSKDQFEKLLTIGPKVLKKMQEDD